MDLARRVRQAMPSCHRRPFSPADAVVVAEAFSGNAFAATALLQHVFPGRTRRSPDLAVAHLAIHRFVGGCMADLWLFVQDMDIERTVPAIVYVHCKGNHGGL